MKMNITHTKTAYPVSPTAAYMNSFHFTTVQVNLVHKRAID